jgi:hypothetical protein
VVHVWRLPRRPLSHLVLGLLVAVALVLAQRPPLSAEALSLGDENSWLRVQNVGDRGASVDVTFYDAAGNRVGADNCPRASGCGVIAPGVGWSFFQQGSSAVPAGYRGSAIVKSDQPFVALLARDAFKGGQFQIDGDTMRLGRGTAGMVFPIVQNTDQYVSRMTIQNGSDTSDACVEVRYWAQSVATVAAIDPPVPGPGCPQGGQLLAPHASIIRDETSLPVPFGFDGSAQVLTYASARGVAARAQTLVGTIDTRERHGAGLGEKRGITPDEQRQIVSLPLIERNVDAGGATWNTRFRIMNAHPGIPNEVALRYEGTDSSGDKVSIDYKVNVVTSLTCDQRSSGSTGCLPPDRDLPGSFSGSVRLQSTEPIAVVAQRTSSKGAFSDYRGFTVGEAARQVVLPVLDKNYGPFGGGSGWNSWFRVLSWDGSPAYVRVVYFARQFPTGQLRDAFSAPEALTVFQAQDRDLPDGWVGSAIVISDQPIVVLVGVDSDAFPGDAAMLYNGVGFD